MSRDTKQRCMALARWCPLMTMLFTCTDGVRSAEMVTPKSRQEATNGRRVPSIKTSTVPYHTIPYSFNNVVDIRNVQQIHIEIGIK